MKEDGADVFHPHLDVQGCDVTLESRGSDRGQERERDHTHFRSTCGANISGAADVCVRDECVCDVDLHLEVADAVTFAQRHLENLQRAEEGGQATQTLFAAAADAHQQRVAVRRLQDATDATTGRTNGVNK